MSKKKIIEIVASILCLLASFGVLVWYYILAVQKSESTVVSVQLADVPLSDLQEAEKGPLISAKVTQIFGNIPVTVSGAEQAKANIFSVDDSEADSGILKTDQYIIKYPKDWWKKANKAGEVELQPPLKDTESQGKVLVYSVKKSITSQKNLENELMSILSSKLGYKPSEAQTYQEIPNANSYYIGKLPFTHKSSGKITKGFVAGAAYSSPNKNTASAVYNLIQKHRKESYFLNEVAKNLKDSPSSISPLLADQSLVDELRFYKEPITFQTPSYNTVVVFIYETAEDNFNNFESQAQEIVSSTTFIESVTGDAINFNPSQNTSVTIEGNTTTINPAPTEPAPWQLNDYLLRPCSNCFLKKQKKLVRRVALIRWHSRSLNHQFQPLTYPGLASVVKLSQIDCSRWSRLKYHGNILWFFLMNLIPPCV